MAPLTRYFGEKSEHLSELPQAAHLSGPFYFFRRTALLYTWVGQEGLCNSGLYEYQKSSQLVVPGVDRRTVLAILLGKRHVLAFSHFFSPPNMIHLSSTSE